MASPPFSRFATSHHSGFPPTASDDTIRGVKRRAIVIGSALWLGACAPISMPLPIQPFVDIPVPIQWTPYSDDWVLIRAGRVTAARLIYFSTSNVETTLAEARRMLTGTGWSETRSERFINREKFPGVWVDFAKGDDLCRVTVIEGAGATHVDYTVARVSPEAR
jgi:hypothetical protein